MEGFPLAGELGQTRYFVRRVDQAHNKVDIFINLPVSYLPELIFKLFLQSHLQDVRLSDYFLPDS